MQIATGWTAAALAFVDGVQQGPEPEDVKAGWLAFAIFLMLAASVALLGVSLVKQLRKAQAAKDAGVYGDEPVDRSDTAAEAADPAEADEQPRG